MRQWFRPGASLIARALSSNPPKRRSSRPRSRSTALGKKRKSVSAPLSLFQQHVLLNTRVSLVVAQRDRVVASYAVMAAIGRLAAAKLNLNVAQYDPTVHFNQVKDKWIGLRTP